ncbi:MAG: hypothetical protein ACK53L_18155, partial [Pirellulaceae bacterium]
MPVDAFRFFIREHCLEGERFPPRTLGIARWTALMPPFDDRAARIRSARALFDFALLHAIQSGDRSRMNADSIPGNSESRMTDSGLINATNAVELHQLFLEAASYTDELLVEAFRCRRLSRYFEFLVRGYDQELYAL